MAVSVVRGSRAQGWGRRGGVGILGVSVVLLVGCAAPAEKEAAVASTKADVVCREVVRAGSRISREKCEDADATARRQRGEDEALGTIPRGVVEPTGPTFERGP